MKLPTLKASLIGAGVLALAAIVPITVMAFTAHARYKSSQRTPTNTTVQEPANATSDTAVKGAAMTKASATPQSSDTAVSQQITTPTSSKSKTVNGSTATPGTQPDAPSNNQITSPTSSDPPTVTVTQLHIGGYPPAVSAALAADFVNPTHTPCSASGPTPEVSACAYDPYEWVATKYCAYTYADGHTQQVVYQYQAYPDAYANSDGSLSTGGINMAIYSTPTASCTVDNAPKSVFEPNYTY